MGLGSFGIMASGLSLEIAEIICVGSRCGSKKKHSWGYTYNFYVDLSIASKNKISPSNPPFGFSVVYYLEVLCNWNFLAVILSFFLVNFFFSIVLVYHEENGILLRYLLLPMSRISPFTSRSKWEKEEGRGNEERKKRD